MCTTLGNAKAKLLKLLHHLVQLRAVVLKSGWDLISVVALKVRELLYILFYDGLSLCV